MTAAMLNLLLLAGDCARAMTDADETQMILDTDPNLDDGGRPTRQDLRDDWRTQALRAGDLLRQLKTEAERLEREYRDRVQRQDSTTYGG